MDTRIRTTISLPQDVYEIFKKMADVSGMSVSRCMGDWLRDTSDGAQLVSMKMQQVKQGSTDAIRDIHKVMEQGGDILDFISTINQEAARSGRARGLSGSSPAPSSNTGLKSTVGAKPGRGKLA